MPVPFPSSEQAGQGTVGCMLQPWRLRGAAPCAGVKGVFVVLAKGIGVSHWTLLTKSGEIRQSQNYFWACSWSKLDEAARWGRSPPFLRCRNGAGVEEDVADLCPPRALCLAHLLSTQWLWVGPLVLGLSLDTVGNTMRRLKLKMKGPAAIFMLSRLWQSVMNQSSVKRQRVLPGAGLRTCTGIGDGFHRSALLLHEYDQRNYFCGPKVDLKPLQCGGREGTPANLYGSASKHWAKLLWVLHCF